METQTCEIKNETENAGNANSHLLKDTKNRHRLFSAPELHAIVKIESSILKGARKYFEEQGFVEVVVPHVTKATGACENIATMFEIDYFGPKRYLSQTGQLYLEVLTPFSRRSGV
jgi:asparaginyl-tRNA synthetase